MVYDNALLTSAHPTNVGPASVTIGHVQLRDVLVCPRERGVVNYVHNQSIVEHNINCPDSTPRKLAALTFVPNTLASMNVPGTDNTLIAAGGQEAEIHLSLHKPATMEESHRRYYRQRSSAIWQFEAPLSGSINNSVMLTSMNLARSNESSIEPRVGISNNDSTVKFYDVPVRGDTSPRTIRDAGMLRLNVAINHSSLSPDGQTLLSVGDSPKVFLHRISGGSRLTFTPITTLTLPPPDVSCPYNISSSLTASFSTAFSSNGTKFAVASQEGAVIVWDVRSSKPFKVFQTDKHRMSECKSQLNSNASEWLSDDPWDWTRCGYRAPGWGVRSVKFGSGDSGREIMTFTEHTSLLHVIDARTFETEEIVRMPTCAGQPHQAPQLSPIPSPRAQSRSRSISPIRPSILPPPPPRILLALEDTFRIPPSSSINDPRTSHARWRASRLRNRADEDEDIEGIVVIPHFGDTVVENDVRQLFGRHGIRTRGAPMESSQSQSGVVFEADSMYDVPAEEEQDRELEHGREREHERERENADEDWMEVDELESDCASSHTPSRSSSPSPSTHIPLQISPSPLHNVHRYHQGRRRRTITPKEDSDLAGTCFDPTGAFIYVASVDGVAEWSVQGAEKRWWFGSEWA